MTLNDRELATFLAALRLAQVFGVAQFVPDYFTEDSPALSVEEIDDLCERLNCGECDA
jgi:hypothetical protein